MDETTLRQANLAILRQVMGNVDMLPLTKGHPVYGRKQETSQRKPEKQNVFTVICSMEYNKHFLRPVFQLFYFLFTVDGTEV